MLPVNLIDKINSYNSHPIADLLRPFFKNVRKFNIDSVIRLLVRNGKFSWTNIYNIHNLDKHGVNYRNVMYQLLVINRYKTKWVNIYTMFI